MARFPTRDCSSLWRRVSPTLLLLLCSSFACLQGISAIREGGDGSYDVHLGSTRALLPGLDGAWVVPESSEGFEQVIRLRILGLSRLHNFTRICHAATIKLDVHKARELGKAKIHVCLHRNETMALGECNETSWNLVEGDLWKPVEGKLWTASVSPFGEHFLDVKVDALALDLGAITVEEEFQPHHAVFLGLGFSLLVLAPAMAACVPLYYSSAMVLSIFAVILIILYQSTKLLPVGRKRAMNMLIVGSLVGVSSMIISYFKSALSKFAILLGMEGGALQPVVVFAVIFVVIAGAGPGFWAVRKFVLGPDGRPDAATKNFVSVSIRIVAFGMLFLSTNDGEFQKLLVGTGGLLVLLGRWGWRLPLSVIPRWRRKTPLVIQTVPEVVTDDQPVSPATPSTKFDMATPKEHTKRRLLESPAPEPTTPARLYLSCIHQTATRKCMTEDEYEESGLEHTAQGLVEMMQSPSFAEWARENAGRIRADPIKGEVNPRGDVSLKDLYKRNAGKGTVDYLSEEEAEGSEEAGGKKTDG